MAYLTICGALNVPVAVNAPSKDRKTIGRSRVGAKTADMTEARRASRWSWDFQTTPMAHDEANSLEQILLGRFHLWDCDGSWASCGGAGLLANAAAGAQRLLFSGPAPFTGVLQVKSGVTIQLAGNLPAAGWTLLAVVTTGGVAHHYGVRSSGHYYKDGIDQATATPPGWMRIVAAGSLPNVAIGGFNDAGGSVDQNYGQVVACPWLMPDAHLAALTSWVTRKWPRAPAGDSPSPVFEVVGSFLDHARANASGELKTTGLMHVATQDNMRSVAFTLRQAELSA